MVAHMIAGTKEGDHVDPQETGTDDEPTHEPSHADTHPAHEARTHHERDASSASQDDVIGRITPRRIPMSEANFTGFSGSRP